MIEEINIRLLELLSIGKDGLVKDAMIYSVMAGGKRIRPVLFLTTLRSYGVNYKDYIDIACAIEIIHTYSLIHDDLPSMDNDDYRRGQLTCHKKFDEATAVLAGDALLNEAILTVSHMSIDDELKIKIITSLFEASGRNGMIYGQQQDMYFESHTADIQQLDDIHHHKTGCMIAICFELAGLIAHPDDIPTLSKLGYALGLAFQIQDDILDETSTQDVLGKPVGSDIKNHKSTYVSLLGMDKAKETCDQLFRDCLEYIYGLRINHGLVIELLEVIRNREK